MLGGDDLSSKVYQTMDKHKDVFFTVLLHPPASDSSPLPGTTDPDQLINCDLMDGRDAFLTMSRERHWEFSSLRRAMFSSISMVYELHTQSEDKFMYNCNSCHLDVVARYHCTECDVSVRVCVCVCVLHVHVHTCMFVTVHVYMYMCCNIFSKHIKSDIRCTSPNVYEVLYRLIVTLFNRLVLSEQANRIVRVA